MGAKMARVKTATKSKAEVDPAPPPTDNRQKSILALKGTEEYKAWLDELAALNGAPVTITVDRALRELAERLGHKKPPRRVP